MTWKRQNTEFSTIPEFSNKEPKKPGTALIVRFSGDSNWGSTKPVISFYQISITSLHSFISFEKLNNWNTSKIIEHLFAIVSEKLSRSRYLRRKTLQKRILMDIFENLMKDHSYTQFFCKARWDHLKFTNWNLYFK